MSKCNVLSLLEPDALPGASGSGWYGSNAPRGDISDQREQECHLYPPLWPTHIQAMKTLVVVADHPMVVQAIRLALRHTAGFRVVATLDGRATARATLSELKPEIVLVDEMCQRTNALARLKEATEESPDAKVVFLSASLDPAAMDDALRRGGARRDLAPAAPGHARHAAARGRPRERRARPAPAAGGGHCRAAHAHRPRARGPAPGRRGPHQRPRRPRSSASPSRRSSSISATSTASSASGTAPRPRATPTCTRSSIRASPPRVRARSWRPARRRSARRRGRPTAGWRTASERSVDGRTSARSRGSSPSSALVPCVSVIVRSVDERSV